MKTKGSSSFSVITLGDIAERLLNDKTAKLEVSRRYLKMLDQLQTLNAAPATPAPAEKKTTAKASVK